jgi:hypothetical protein
MGASAGVSSKIVCGDSAMALHKIGVKMHLKLQDVFFT